MEAVSVFRELPRERWKEWDKRSGVGAGWERGQRQHCSESRFTIDCVWRKNPVVAWWEWHVNWTWEYVLGKRRLGDSECRKCWLFMVEGLTRTKALRQEGSSTVMKLKETQLLELERERYKWICRSSLFGPSEDGKPSSGSQPALRIEMKLKRIENIKCVRPSNNILFCETCVLCIYKYVYVYWVIRYMYITLSYGVLGLKSLKQLSVLVMVRTLDFILRVMRNLWRIFKQEEVLRFAF